MLILSIILGAIALVLGTVTLFLSLKLKANRRSLVKVSAQNKVLFDDNNSSRRSLRELKADSSRYRELLD